MRLLLAVTVLVMLLFGCGVARQTGDRVEARIQEPHDGDTVTGAFYVRMENNNDERPFAMQLLFDDRLAHSWRNEQAAQYKMDFSFWIRPGWHKLTAALLTKEGYVVRNDCMIYIKTLRKP